MSALLAMSATGNGDKVGMLLFHRGADTYIPPRKGGKHALRIVREVLARGEGRPPLPAYRTLWQLWKRRRRARLDPQSSDEVRRGTSISNALEFCRQVLPRRSVLFLISDFLDDGYLKVLRHANRKHDVVAALITDLRETEMPPAGLVTLQDAETGALRLVDTTSSAFRDELATRGKTRRKELADQLRATGMDLVTFDASGSMVDPLARVLSGARAEAAPVLETKRLALVAVLAASSGKSLLDSSNAAPPTEPPKDAIVKPVENGPVKLAEKVWPAKPTLGEPIYLRLEIDAALGAKVDAPFQEAGDQRMGKFRVIGFTRDAHRNADGGQHEDQTYTLEAPTSGKHRIPPLRLEMIDTRAEAKTAGKPQELLTEEIPLDIAPVKTEAIGSELHAAAGELDEDVGGIPWMTILLAASERRGDRIGARCSRCAACGLAGGSPRNAARIDEAVAKLRTLEDRGAPWAAAMSMRGSWSSRRSCATTSSAATTFAHRS